MLSVDQIVSSIESETHNPTERVQRVTNVAVGLIQWTQHTDAPLHDRLTSLRRISIAAIHASHQLTPDEEMSLE